MEELLRLLIQNQQSPAQSLASAIPAFLYSRNLNKYYAPSQALLGAQTDINSPTYQNIYKQQKQQGQQNLSESVAELSRQNRVLTRMGRSPLLDNERGGENIFRNVIRGYQDVQNQAANDTQGILQNAYQGQLMQDQLRAQNGAKKSSVTGNIAGSIAKLFGL